MTIKKIRNEIFGDIRRHVPEGHCVEMIMFLGRENEPHHVDMHWDRYLTCLFNYKGHLLYSSNGCHICDLEEISSLDILISIQEAVRPRLTLSISDERKKEIDADYRIWGYKEWERSVHTFRYWTWDGKEKRGPYKICQPMRLDEARTYVREEHRNTSCRSFDLQEVDGLIDTYFVFSINGED